MRARTWHRLAAMDGWMDGSLLLWFLATVTGAGIPLAAAEYAAPAMEAAEAAATASVCRKQGRGLMPKACSISCSSRRGSCPASTCILFDFVFGQAAHIAMIGLLTNTKLKP